MRWIFLTCCTVVFISFGALAKTDCKTRLFQCENRKPAPHKPVCGTDNQTYPNRCALLRVQCMQSTPLTVKYKGKCKEKQPCWLDQSKNLNKDKEQGASSDYISECLPDGTYAPVQCHKSTGYCWCVTSNGKMIPRTAIIGHQNLKCPQRGPSNSQKTSTDGGNNAKKGCDQTDKNTFVNNLVRIFKTEYNRDVFSKQYNFPVSQNTSRLEENAIQWKFAMLDKDKNNSLNRNEYRDLRKLVKKVVKPRRCSRAFVRLCDADRNSVISRAEWTDCLSIVKHTTSTDRPINLQLDDQQKKEEEIEDELTIEPPRGGKKDALPLSDRPSISESEDKLNDCLSDRKAVMEELRPNNQEIYIPDCMPDGSYKKVQCYPSTGYCWCVMEDSGKPIPGTLARDFNPKCDNIQPLHRPMKGCPDHKKITFIKDLMAFFSKNLTASESDDEEETVKGNQKGYEQLASLGFHSLDANKNDVLDRQEWKTFRAMMATSKTMKRCGRKLPRYCDTNHDNKITKHEWTQCLSLQIVPSSISTDAHSNTQGPKRRGPNPIESYLKDDD